MAIPTSTARKCFYLEKYSTLVVNPDVIPQAKIIADRINQNISSYGLVSSPFNIPGWVIGILHNMESDGDFDTHLANGDPLSADTVDVPAGLMAKYCPTLKPPFDFIQAAKAALQDYISGWNSLVITDTMSALNFFDCWNGLGYWNHLDLSGNPQDAYLFSGTNAYTAGKFVSDGTWNEQTVSQQIGCAAVMKALGL